MTRNRLESFSFSNSAPTKTHYGPRPILPLPTHVTLPALPQVTSDWPRFRLCSSEYHRKEDSFCKPSRFKIWIRPVKNFCLRFSLFLFKSSLFSLHIYFNSLAISGSCLLFSFFLISCHPVLFSFSAVILSGVSAVL